VIAATSKPKKSPMVENSTPPSRAARNPAQRLRPQGRPVPAVARTVSGDTRVEQTSVTAILPGALVETAATGESTSLDVIAAIDGQRPNSYLVCALGMTVRSRSAPAPVLRANLARPDPFQMSVSRNRARIFCFANRADDRRRDIRPRAKTWCAGRGPRAGHTTQSSRKRSTPRNIKATLAR